MTQDESKLLFYHTSDYRGDDAAVFAWRARPCIRLSFLAGVGGDCNAETPLKFLLAPCADVDEAAANIGLAFEVFLYGRGSACPYCDGLNLAAPPTLSREGGPLHPTLRPAISFHPRAS